MKLVKIALLFLVAGLVACEKENMDDENSTNKILHQEIMVADLHNTNTSMNVPVAKDEVLFSFILHSTNWRKRCRCLLQH